MWYTNHAMKRIFLFVVTNLAVMLVMMVAFHVICALLGVDPNAAFQGTGLDLVSLAIFALVFGMGGAIISLLLSKTIAKFSVGARVVNGTEGEAERWLVATRARPTPSRRARSATTRSWRCPRRSWSR